MAACPNAGNIFAEVAVFVDSEFVAAGFVALKFRDFSGGGPVPFTTTR